MSGTLLGTKTPSALQGAVSQLGERLREAACAESSGGTGTRVGNTEEWVVMMGRRAVRQQEWEGRPQLRAEGRLKPV